MGLVQVQVIWHLLNICVFCVIFGGSSGFSETLSLESYSPIPSIESQAPQSRSVAGLALQPPTVTPSTKLAPFNQNDKGPPLIPSFRDSATPPLATLPMQTPHESSPPLSAEPPADSVHPVVKPPVTESAHAPSAIILPVDTSPPPVVKSAHAPLALILPVDTSPPPVAESAHVPSALISPVDTTPPPVVQSTHAPSALVSPVDITPPAVEPPLTFDIPLPAKPPQVFIAEPPVKAPPFLPTPPPKESPQHAPIVEFSPLPLPVLSPPSQLEPSQISPPTALVPSNASVPPPLILPFPLEGQPPPSSPPLAAKPPQLSIPEIPVEVPPFLSTPQISPLPLPVFSPLPSLPSSPPVTEPTVYEPPPPAYESPPFVHSPSVLPVAEPPHASSLPLPAHPPDTSPLLPVAEPPKASTLVPPPEIQPVFPSSPPASATQFPPIPVIESSPPPQLVPSTASSPVSQLVPVNASSPTVSSIQTPPAISSSPPPQLPSLNASSPVPPLAPLSSPPTPALPPSSSFSPPLIVPSPMNSPPDLPTLPPTGPQNTSSPPPQLDVPPLPSPPTFMFPTPALPPSSSFSSPLMVPPPMNSPPQNASSLPPQIGPPLASYPPPQLVVPPPASPPTSLFPPPALPPNSSFSPPLMAPPPMDSPPHLTPPFPPVPQNTSSPPASPPTSALPSVSPPSMMPSLSPPIPPPGFTLSPPLPSQAVSPLPHLVPPHSFSPPLADPPQVFSAPPPVKIPGEIPPRGSSPPIFSSPPLASPQHKKGSHASVSPPLKSPSHDLLAPPPSTVHASPPHSSQRKVTQHQASPPLPTSLEIPPPSGISPRAAPPSKQVMPKSPPPLQQPVGAPKHSAPSSRLNASEPHSPPLPAPAPRNKPGVNTAPQPLPPPQEPEQLSPANISPRHAPSKPKFERDNGTAPAPSTVQVNPSVNATHHSRHHSAGAPMVVAPLPSPQRIHIISSAASPVPHAPPGDSEIPLLSPKISPSESSPRNNKKSLAPPIRSLPPPPPNTDCAYLTCPEPSTNTPPGSPCGCVWPMQVGMRLSVALYTFFPLVSELAKEIASGVFLKQSQVRVMGANAAPQDPEKTIVVANLVPLDDKFDNITSHLISDRFWNKQVIIDKSIFGDYDILYVRYPGLPPSPPLAPADMAVINGMPYTVGDPNANKLHPLGVDVTKQGHKHRLNAIIIAVIVLSAVLGVLMCCSLAWVLVFRHTNNNEQPTLTPRAVASLGRSSGPTGLSTGSGHSSPPLSLGSSLATYTGSAKTFSGREIEKATDNFNPSRILGEGGFGLVYSGDLDDETRVAVKVLKRDDQQGGREFLAEVEMLSRLHHRNLVKLIGICTEERMRCLVYELIENGSVDSHLHGTDRDITPLDWASRIKIALGAARGLAYLHEDSSPRVIHRDFKSSNILLENDFTAKVSDFGLARTAMDEENRHISTRVMGTFGYVAPEYAMTGHLLVKSDVYSYGVVLLELLTGRKPVDMSQPDGQENLVAWTRPLLTSKEGLESIIDPSLGSQVPFESVAKVAAIASMCVQPEVSHRPFMGEVVQALKLVCNECDDSKDGDSRSNSRENLSIDFDAKVSSPASGTHEPLEGQFSLPNYEPRHDVEKGMSVSEIFSASASLGQQASDSFRRHSASGPLRTARGPQFWQRIRGRSRGSVSEHGIMYKLWTGSN